MTIEDWKRDSGAAGNDQFAFVSDGQDVEAVKLHLGTVAEEFDSFFLRAVDGEDTDVYGMEGIVPRLDKQLVCILRT